MENLDIQDSEVTSSVTQLFEDSTNSYINSSGVGVDPSYEVVRHKAEQVIFGLYILACGMISLVGNSSALYLVRRNHSLHQPHFYIICCYAISDICLSCTVCPMLLTVLLGYDVMSVSQLVCSIHGSVMMIITFTQIHMLGWLAFERFFFFCHPLVYPIYFTGPRTVGFVGILWMFSIVFGVVVEFTSGRQLYVTVMCCQVARAVAVLLVQATCYIVPVFVIVSYSAYNIIKVLRSHQVEPHASIRQRASGITAVKGIDHNFQPTDSRQESAPSSNKTLAQHHKASNTHERAAVTPSGQIQPPFRETSTNQVTAVQEDSAARLKRKAKVALRVVLLTSGVFYGVYIPTLIVRFLVFGWNGASWLVVERGDYPWMGITLRVSNTTLLVLPSALNAVIYFYTHIVLRRAFVKTFCLRRNVVHPDIVNFEGSIINSDV